MIIAIDFDDTYTKDPEFWNQVIVLAQGARHRVLCVTCRHDTPENREIVRIPYIPGSRHYFTGLASKKWFLGERGIDVDVWIDDNPCSITRGM